jgi:large subunit ribosomal protein L21
MYAVIKTGGKQYRVAKDDIIEVELLDTPTGGTVTLDQVLLVGDKIGAPTVAGASVKATVLNQKKGDKIIVFKKKRRQNYRRKNGHRQNITVLKITDIKA